MRANTRQSCDLRYCPHRNGITKRLRWDSSQLLGQRPPPQRQPRNNGIAGAAVSPCLCQKLIRALRCCQSAPSELDLKTGESIQDPGGLSLERPEVRADHAGAWLPAGLARDSGRVEGER